MSFHLKELVRAGLVTARQDRQFIYYAVDFERMAELMTFLTQNCCQGMPEKCLTVVETALGSCCAPADSKPKHKEEAIMKRFHVHVSVDDLEANIKFYSTCVRSAAYGGQA